MKTERALICLLTALSLQAAVEYRKALPGYSFEFPRDYFNHPEFRTEWWYYTGNLRAVDGRRFGYELTFFRHKLRPEPRRDANVWDIDDVWMAHFALTDVDGRRFMHTERFNRTGAGQAGAKEGRVWNGNWFVDWQLDPRTPAGFSEKRLQAIADGFAIDLTFRSEKPPVVHGHNGVSQKAAGLGRASHYVSLTRLLTGGMIRLDGRDYQVTGQSWMDHEFFTHLLSPDQVGWDWFSLQFDDGTELMLFRLRRKDGTVESYSSGTWVDKAGKTRHLPLPAFDLTPGRTWRSPRTGGEYPVEWKVRVPSLGIDVDIRATLDSQELSSSRTYWEGSVEITGSHSGRGYVEMTGYAADVGQVFHE